MDNKKKVPVLRFPEFSGEWKNKEIKEVTSYVDYRGKTPQKSDKGIFLVTAKNIRFGYIDYDKSKEYIPEETYQEVMKRGKPLIGDVLITTEAPPGNVASIDKEGIALAQRVIKLRGIKNLMDNGFLKFNLLSPFFQKILKEKSSGGTVKGFKGSELHKIGVNLPVFQEQQKIADFLTKIDNKIEQLIKKKQLLESYKKGTMQKIFSQDLRFKDDEGKDYPDWKEKKLGEIAKIYDGTHTTPDYKKEGIPFYSVEHLTSNNFLNTKFIYKEVFEKENKRVKLEKGDVLMTRIGDIGTSKYIDWDVNASFYVSLALIKKSDSNNTLFINQYIKSSFFQKELHKRIIHVAFPKKINLGEISHCLIKLPALTEQVKIANFLTEIDQKINLVEKQLNDTQNYKKGLLQQMFV